MTTHSTLAEQKVLLEVLSDRELTEIARKCDVLFTGKVVNNKEGGFKKLYDLPSVMMLIRSKLDLISDWFTVRIIHHGWLCNRDSRWIRAKCKLFFSSGLLFVYMKANRGYALKMNSAREMREYTRVATSYANMKDETLTHLKFTWNFGSLGIRLEKSQLRKWRRALLNAYESILPCVEPPKLYGPKVDVATSISKGDLLSACSQLATPYSSEDSWVTATSSLARSGMTTISSVTTSSSLPRISTNSSRDSAHSIAINSSLDAATISEQTSSNVDSTFSNSTIPSHSLSTIFSRYTSRSTESSSETSIAFDEIPLNDEPEDTLMKTISTYNAAKICLEESSTTIMDNLVDSTRSKIASSPQILVVPMTFATVMNSTIGESGIPCGLVFCRPPSHMRSKRDPYPRREPQVQMVEMSRIPEAIPNHQLTDQLNSSSNLEASNEGSNNDIQSTSSISPWKEALMKTPF